MYLYSISFYLFSLVAVFSALMVISARNPVHSVLYTDYFYLFQISGLILLVAMVGSITLTLRDRGQVKRQNISSQNFIDANNAIEKKKIKLGKGI